MFTENDVDYGDRNRHLSNHIAVKTSCTSDNGHWQCNIVTIRYATQNNSPAHFPVSHFVSLLQFVWEINPFFLHLLNLFSPYLALTLIFLLPISLSVSSLLLILLTLLFLCSFAAHHRAVWYGGKPLDLYGNTPGTSPSLVPSIKLQDSNSIRLRPF